jgi:hypothetical protein
MASRNGTILALSKSARQRLLCRSHAHLLLKRPALSGIRGTFYGKPRSVQRVGINLLHRDLLAGKVDILNRRTLSPISHRKPSDPMVPCSPPRTADRHPRTRRVVGNCGYPWSPARMSWGSKWLHQDPETLLGRKKISQYFPTIYYMFGSHI